MDRLHARIPALCLCLGLFCLAIPGVAAQGGALPGLDSWSGWDLVPVLTWASPDPLELQSGDCLFLHDRSGSLSADQVLRLFQAPQARPDPHGGHYGYLDGAVWLGFRFKTSAQAADLAIQEGYGVDSFEVWLVDGQSLAPIAAAVPDQTAILKLYRTSGWASEAASRDLPARHVTVVFPLRHPEGASPVYAGLVRLSSNTSLSLHLAVADSRTFLGREQPWLVFLGGFLVLMAFALGACLYLAWHHRDSLFLSLAVYVLLSGVYILYGYGFANWLIWPGLPALGRVTATWGWAVIALMSLQIISRSLGLRQRQAGAFGVAVCFMALLAVLALVFNLLEARVAYLGAAVLGLAFPLMLGVVIALAMLAGIRHAWIFAISLGFLAMGLLLVNLRNLGLWGDSPWIDVLAALTVFSQWITFMLPLSLAHRSGQRRPDRLARRTPDPGPQDRTVGEALDSPDPAGPAGHGASGRPPTLFRD